MSEIAIWLGAVVLIVAVVVAFFEAILEFSADAINWILRKTGISRAAEPTWPATVTKPFVASDDPEVFEGTVSTRGEIWTARCDSLLATELKVGDDVIVRPGDGIHVRVQSRGPAV